MRAFIAAKRAADDYFLRSHRHLVDNLTDAFDRSCVGDRLLTRRFGHGAGQRHDARLRRHVDVHPLDILVEKIHRLHFRRDPRVGDFLAHAIGRTLRVRLHLLGIVAAADRNLLATGSSGTGFSA